MESRHDSENAERILYNMRPKELVSRTAEPLAAALPSIRASLVAEQGICLLELSLRCRRSEVPRERLIRAPAQGREVSPAWSKCPLPSAQTRMEASLAYFAWGRWHRDRSGRPADWNSRPSLCPLLGHLGRPLDSLSCTSVFPKREMMVSAGPECCFGDKTDDSHRALRTR